MKFIFPAHAHSSDLVAFDGSVARTVGQLMADADKLAKAIRTGLSVAEFKKISEKSLGYESKPEVLVICADRYHFAVALLAAWKANVVAALPPNGQEATVHALAARPEIHLIIHDTDRDTSGRSALDLRNVISKPSGADSDSLDFSGEAFSDSESKSDPLKSTNSAESVALKGLKNATLNSQKAPDVSCYNQLKSLNILASERDFAPLVLEGREKLVTLYTSGSTGEHKRCPKAAAELLGEAVSHVASFHIQPGEVFAATVPGHHVYGLIWSVLVPLMSGGVLDRKTTLFPEAVVAHAEEIGASYLISVPAHLRTLAEVDAMPSFKRITSSGAPLSPETAQKIFEKFGLRITEIFGSSETGGIAFREEPGEPHRPLAGVKISCGDDGRLLLDSPFLPLDVPRPLPCDDRIELLADGRFILKGRMDGVVKVGGKRVALAEVEQRIFAMPGVKDVAVTAEVVDSGRGIELWAAIVGQVTKKEVRDELKKWLDPVALPRRILFVSALPREENGKLKKANLKALFAVKDAGTSEVNSGNSAKSESCHSGNFDDFEGGECADCVEGDDQLPVADFFDSSVKVATAAAENKSVYRDEAAIRRCQRVFAEKPVPLSATSEERLIGEGKDGWRLTIPIPEDYYYFRGHFDGLPILPGVVQLDFIVRRQIARLWPDLNRGPRRIIQLKFKKTIRPGTILTVTLERSAGTNRVNFELADGNQSCSQGKFIF